MIFFYILHIHINVADKISGNMESKIVTLTSLIALISGSLGLGTDPGGPGGPGKGPPGVQGVRWDVFDAASVANVAFGRDGVGQPRCS